MTRALFLLLALTGTAQAHDFWISKGQYVNPSDGVHCCGERDCFQIPAASIVSTPKGYLLPNGELVPYSEATPSEDGLFWRCQKSTGERRCFFAPTGST